jgi:hypothetical protein
VLAHVHELGDADDVLGHLAGPAADAGNERVAPGQVAQDVACRVGDARVLGALYDRGQDAVDVEEEGCARGLRGKTCERVHARTVDGCGSC